MKNDVWIGIEVAEDAATGWRFDGTAPVARASGPHADDVQAQLGQAPALIVAQADGVEPVPAPVLPANLPLSALGQDRPLGHLEPAARLRIAGVLAGRRNWDGVICLHMTGATHWCQISAEEVVSFQSALTPALARVLGASDDAAPQSVADSMSRPERLSVQLRSATLAGDGAALAGHLVGAELAAMRPYWLGQRIIVIARNSLYSAALAAQGVPVETVHPDAAAQAGLVALRQISR